jgi:putative acetyltransferase
VSDSTIIEDDPRAVDVRELLERHLDLMHSQSPPEDVHALDVDRLLDPAVTFYSFRLNGKVLGVGALKELDPGHGELKSMHTASAARGRGIGRTMLEHLIGVARNRGYTRLSLETGSMTEFAPARSLYARAGFRYRDPFGDYSPSPNSVFMTLDLVAAALELFGPVTSWALDRSVTNSRPANPEGWPAQSRSPYCRFHQPRGRPSMRMA